MSPKHNKLNSTHSQQVSSTKLRAKQPTHKKLLLHHAKISRTLLTSFNITHTFLCFSGARACHHVNVTDVHASLCAPKQQNMVMFIGMSLFLLVMINFWFLKTKRRRHNQSKLRHAIPGHLAGNWNGDAVSHHLQHPGQELNFTGLLSQGDNQAITRLIVQRTRPWNLAKLQGPSPLGSNGLQGLQAGFQLANLIQQHDIV